MCETIVHGYKTNRGVVVDYQKINLSELPPDAKEELSQSPASQLDLLHVRSSLHNLRNDLQRLMDGIEMNSESIAQLRQSVEKATFVEVQNGDKKNRVIGELIAELWERDTHKREITPIKKFMKKHKIIIGGAALLLLLLFDAFRNEVHQLVQWIFNNIAALSKFIN